MQNLDIATAGASIHEIVFSLVDGSVWAHWPATGDSIRLGTNEGVSAMMRDYLKQCDAAEQLTRLADARALPLD